MYRHGQVMVSADPPFAYGQTNLDLNKQLCFIIDSLVNRSGRSTQLGDHLCMVREGLLYVAWIPVVSGRYMLHRVWSEVLLWTVQGNHFWGQPLMTDLRPREIIIRNR